MVLPGQPQKRIDMMTTATNRGPDPPQLPQFCVPVEQERAAMLSACIIRPTGPRSTRSETRNGKRCSIDWDPPASKLDYLPMRANANDGALILDADSGAILVISMLTPSSGNPSAAPPTGRLARTRIRL